MSSSQLTFIFFRGVGQPPTSYVYHDRHDPDVSSTMDSSGVVANS